MDQDWHDRNLNIHYTAPRPIWEQIEAAYASMPYWCGAEDGPRWVGEGIDLRASVEPGGIQLFGAMPQEIWASWFPLLKQKLGDVMGYEIGEPEDGYEFRYFDPPELSP